MGGVDKLTLPLLGKPLLATTLSPFLSWGRLKGLVLAVSPGRVEEFQSLLASEFSDTSRWEVIEGGVERQDSIRLALEKIKALWSPAKNDVVLIHDGARPFVDSELFHRLLEKLSQYSGVIPTAPVRDTIKRVDGDKVLQTEDRESLRLVQTPQAFPFETILSVHLRANQEGFLGTDDASLLEHYGMSVGCVPGAAHNLKVTVPEDVPILEELSRRMKQG